MDVLNKLVRINLKKNKQRTIVSIIGIILSCALITALMTMASSIMATLLEESLISGGHRHVSIYNVAQEDIKDIALHQNVDSYYLTNSQTALSPSALESESVIEHNYIGFIGMDSDAIEEVDNFLLEGRKPETTDEIVIDPYYQGKYHVQIGDEITLEIGSRYSEGYELDHHNPYNEEVDEVFEIKETKTYRVVGIATYYSFLRTMYQYNFYTLDDTITDNANMHLTYNKPKDYASITAELVKGEVDSIGAGVNNLGEYSYSVNDEFFRWSGYSVSDNTQSLIYTLIAILGFIIMGTSVFCIRNSFAISVAEKIKLYGMLASMGATPKQIKNTVLKEGYYMGIIGIPLGIASGITAGYILINFTSYIFNSVGNDFSMIFKISYSSIAISLILSSLTIYFSALGSSKKASKVTEIEAIKNNYEIKVKQKKLKCQGLIKRIFKVGGLVAYKNMTRNKSKYRATIISIVVSITSFISISYFINLTLNITGEIYKDYSYNFSVDIREGSKSVEEKNEIFGEISTFEYIEEYSINMSKELLIEDKYLDQDFGGGIYEDSTIIKILSVDENTYFDYLHMANLGYDEVNQLGIIVQNQCEVYSDSGIHMETIINESINDITIYNRDETYSLDLGIVFSDVLPMGQEGIWGSQIPVMLVSEEVFAQIDGSIAGEPLYIQSDNPRELQNLLYEYMEKEEISLVMFNLSEYQENNDKVVLLISVFLYGFIAVITLIGLTNIFNTITTNMMLRSREFAIMKSIGMTNREFKNMIWLESLMYGVKSLFWGLFFGLGLSYLIFEVMYSSNTILSQDTFILPWTSIIIAIIFVFFIINIIMRYSLSKINKQNTIEAIKNENI